MERHVFDELNWPLFVFPDKQFDNHTLQHWGIFGGKVSEGRRNCREYDRKQTEL